MSVSWISPDGLADKLTIAGLPVMNVGVRTILCDSLYATLTKRGAEDLMEFMADDLASKGLAKWRENEWDCDKFARWAAAEAALIHLEQEEKHKEEHGVQRSGLALGWIAYDVGGNPQRHHAINVVVTRDGGDTEVRFFEPQGMVWVELSDAEKRSVSAIVI